MARSLAVRFFLAVLGVAAAAVPGALKKQVKIPGWPELPFPFSEGVLHCTQCTSEISPACTLKISGNQGFDFKAKPPGLVPGGISNQTKYTMMNIAAIAEAANATMDDITSCTVWLTNIADFEAMNDVYKTFFSKPYPTRAAAGGYDLAGHGALVEISCEGMAPCPM